VPELPEVETVVRSLAPIAGQRILGTEFRNLRILRGGDPVRLSARLEGRRMTRVGFFNRRIRGFRIVEIGAMAVLVALVLVVYLAKDGAGDKRADIDRVQEQIVAVHQK